MVIEIRTRKYNRQVKRPTSRGVLTSPHKPDTTARKKSSQLTKAGDG